MLFFARADTLIWRVLVKTMLAATSVLVFMASHAASASATSPDWHTPPRDADVLSSNSELSTELGLSEGELKAIRSQFNGNQFPNTDKMSRHAKGGWTGSGGGGVVWVVDFFSAFDTSSMFKKRLRPGAESQVRKIQVLDYNVLLANSLTPIQPPKNVNNSLEFIEYILKTQLDPVHPLLAQKLRVAVEAVHPRKWFHRSSQPTIEDNTVSFNCGPSHCTNVQIITRFERSQGESKPQVFIDADFGLLSLIHELNPKPVAIINEAMLIMHEALYALAIGSGSGSSSELTNLNVYIFAKDLRQDLKSKRPRNLDRVREFLNELIQRSMPNYAMVYGFTPSDHGTSVQSLDEFAAADQAISRFVQEWTKSTGWSSWKSIRFLNPATDRGMRSLVDAIVEQRSDAEAFMFYGKFTSLSKWGEYGHKVQDIYLQPALRDQIFGNYCLSIQYDLRGLRIDSGSSFADGALKELAKPWIPIAEKAARYCRERGAPLLEVVGSQALFDLRSRAGKR